MKSVALIERIPLILIALFASVFFTTSVFAQDLNWSFAEQPHPGATDLTVEEVVTIDEVEIQNSEPGTFCEKMLQIEFGIYSARYPAFAKTGSEHARKTAWKTHIVGSGNRSTSLCVIDEIYIKLLQSTSAPSKSGLVFCGRYSREPATLEEKHFAEYMGSLVGYARMGSPDAISSLLATSPMKPLISLNSDVEYFLRKSLEQSGEHDSRWGSRKLKSLLDNERVKFLDEAVENHNLPAVLLTTPACVSHK